MATGWLQGCGPATDKTDTMGSAAEISAAGAPILFISLDTLRADMLGAYGYRDFPTSPFLDRLAEESILFEHCIIQEPRTLTSHMSLFTGLYPQFHRVQDDVPLAPEIPTLATMLQDAGYSTQGFADNGWLRDRWGFDRGFDGYEASRNRGFKEIIPEAREWLNAHKDQKFFLFMHTYDVHSDGNLPFYKSPQPFRGMFSQTISSPLASMRRAEFKAYWNTHGDTFTDDDRAYVRALYAEGIRHVDHELEQFFDFLRDIGVYDRAVIVIWSDHGEGLLDHTAWGHWELFDHTVKVPLLIKIPGVEGGVRIRSQVSSVDLAPTLLELLGVEATARMNGRSALRFLQREDPDVLAYSMDTKQGARRFATRSLTHKLYVDETSGERFLFDLETDPGETHNIHGSSGNFPSLIRLEEALQAWIVSHDHAYRNAPENGSSLIDDEVEQQLRALGYL